KLLVDSVNNDNESIDQITSLYIRDWQLDQRFIDILKKVLPLQEQLHTLENVSLDGNPLAADYFYLFIEKDDSK
ncbi:unnamed protein product, partial [Rotaria sordida]